MPFGMATDGHSNWRASTRGLIPGELARDTDTEQLRMGDGRHGWAGLPPYTAGGSPELFNAGPDTLRYLRMLLARARAGSATALPMIMCGASIDTGVGGTNRYTLIEGGGGIDGQVEMGATSAYGYVLGHALGAAGVPIGGTGWVAAWNNTFDTRWTHGFSGTPANNDVLYRLSGASGQVETFSSDVAGTTVQVAVMGDSGAYSVSIDSAAAVGVAAPGTGTTAVSIYQVTGLSNIVHRVAVTATTTTVVKLVAIRVAGNPGIEWHGWGMSGAKSPQQSTTLGAPGCAGFCLQPARGMITTPGVVFLGCDTFLNDGGGSASAANIAGSKANISTAIADAQTAGHQVILTLPGQVNPATNGSTATWLAWQQACYQMALANGVPLLDMTRRWKDYTTAASWAYYYDNVHPSSLGYEDWVAGLVALLTAGAPQALCHWDPAPVALTLNAGFTAWGSSFFAPSYAKSPDGNVRLSGMLNTGTSAINSIIATLPTGYRPGQYRGFKVLSTTTTASPPTMGRIDIYPDGTLRFAAGTVGTAGAPTYVTLDGISFFPEQ